MNYDTLIRKAKVSVWALHSLTAKQLSSSTSWLSIIEHVYHIISLAINFGKKTLHVASLVENSTRMILQDPVGSCIFRILHRNPGKILAGLHNRGRFGGSYMYIGSCWDPIKERG